jgi:small GTP-binding protein
MPFIVGTAGHIDHGKTALVKALTGQDTDRLKEEKERGISIDLGFAELTLPDGTRAGVVDVPGHERFIKNMLAGAHGIDLVLFVVAADDGVMPRPRAPRHRSSPRSQSGIVVVTRRLSTKRGSRKCARKSRFYARHVGKRADAVWRPPGTASELCESRSLADCKRSSTRGRTSRSASPSIAPS